MVKKWVRLLAVILIALLPILLYFAYLQWTAPPKRITIAAGKPGGVYKMVADKLAVQIEKQTRTSVTVVETTGSLENLLLLRKGEVDFAFYQPATFELLATDKQRAAVAEKPQPTTVANLYSQTVHLIVREGAGIERPEQLAKKRVGIGLPGSGDYAMSLLLLREFQLGFDQVDAKELNFDQTLEAFENDSIDAAILCIGTQAPIFRKLFATHKCRLLELPHADAMVLKTLSLKKRIVPRGLYGAQPDHPPVDIGTVASGAQLLTRADMHTDLVTRVTQLATNPDFARENGFVELFTQGRQYARERPEFPLHPGASYVYTPEFEIGQLEGWEALYSLIASAVIGGVLLFRWIRRIRSTSQEHKWDRYIHRLLDIERKQLHFDDRDSDTQVQELQKILDDVTFLRQEALKEFTAHELNVDQAAECFINMCAALSAKINAKLTRMRFDQKLDMLIERQKESE
ncbi:MAG: TRAP transporter TAXI family solute receptor [Pirellulaceae bacterium]|jgi:TRAP transporter TAXI family solute receptor